MDHYIDIRLLPDPEFPPPVLMNALFSKLHRRLVEAGGGEIGVSFPGYREDPPQLGQRLRLHGSLTALDRLMQAEWLSGMRDLLHVEGPFELPPVQGYRQVHRVQAKSSPERLRRRRMKRHHLSPEQARRAVPDEAAERLRLPYVVLDSRSTGQRFRLFIRQGPLQDRPGNGTFSHYGLGNGATVPWF
jgi:CRISPR-associated endonuclease Csy4